MTSTTTTMYCTGDQHYWRSIRCQCGKYEWNQVEVERLVSENAALRERVQELEAEVEQWRTGNRKHSEADTLLEGFGVDDYEDIFGGTA